MEQRRMLSVVAAIGLLASLASCGASHTHDLMLIDRLEPTCISDGHEAYYQCQVPTCMEIFKDSEAKESTTLEAVKLPATGIHKGGHADCQHRAVCEVCGQEYGELGSHVYDKTVASDAYLSSAATCTEAATYFYSCVCGEKGTETFASGDPLGHDYQATDTDDVFRCTRCQEYKALFDFENADSNAWNVEGAEYRDTLWKIGGSCVGQHGEFVIGHLNQVIEEANLPGKVYLAFNLTSLQAVTAKLSIGLLLGFSSVSKSVFKLEVNGQTVVTPGEFAGQYSDYQHVELFDYADVSLKEGFNEIKFTIMDSPKSNVDYITLESEEWVNEHDFAYEHDADNHWLKCTDEGCDATCAHAPHAFDQEVKDAQYLKTKASCTNAAVYYKSCVCGLAGTETFGGESSGASHTYDQQVVADRYLASPATCTTAALYYYSCVCGEKGTATFSYGDPLGHDYQSIDGNYLNQKCSRCDSYRHRVEFESLKSNAWNEEGAEYRDQLWKCTGDSAKVSNGWSVKHINDNAVAQPEKFIWNAASACSKRRQWSFLSAWLLAARPSPDRPGAST